MTGRREVTTHPVAVRAGGLRPQGGSSTPPATPDPLVTFRRCQSAEDYFTFLDVPYDPRVLNVYRLHILRHFAGQLQELDARRDARTSPAHALTTYREALLRSYQAFTTGTAMDHRLFKVLQDHAPTAFVPTAEITVERRLPGSGSPRSQEDVES